MKELKKFLKPDGVLRRGTLARAAEYLGANKNSVKKWMEGEWQPSLQRARRIRQMIESGIDLSPRKSPGRPRKNGSAKRATPPTR